MTDLRLSNVFQLPSRRISRKWTRSGTNLVIFLEAICVQTNLFWRGLFDYQKDLSTLMT